MIFRKPVRPERANARLFQHSGVNEGKSRVSTDGSSVHELQRGPSHPVLQDVRSPPAPAAPLSSSLLGNAEGLRPAECPLPVAVVDRLTPGKRAAQSKLQFQKSKANSVRALFLQRKRERERGRKSESSHYHLGWEAKIRLETDVEKAAHHSAVVA